MKENQEANENILVDAAHSLNDQHKQIEDKLVPILNNQHLDAILNVAGGWAGGNAASDKLLQNSDLMWKQSVWSSLISASLASKYLNANGVLTLPGSAAALNATPGMIGYGIAKAAVHQLSQTLAAENSGLPAQSFVAAILPSTLDTPMNRKWMPNADFSTWTPLGFVADLMEKWINGEQRPKNGALVKLNTVNSETTLEIQ